MLKVIAACGSGVGTSQMIKIKIERVFKKLAIPVTITHCSVGDAKMISRGYDVIFCSQNFVELFAKAEEKGTIVIGLRNLLDEKKIEEEVLAKVLNK